MLKSWSRRLAPQNNLVALLAGNPAWTEMMSDSLAERGSRCASFQQAASLTVFRRVTPVHLLLLDPDPDDLALVMAAGYFRRVAVAYPLFRTIGLTRIMPAFHYPLIASGLDVVIRKPIASAELVEHVENLLLQRGTSVTRSQRTKSTNMRKRDDFNNVIQLFR